MDWHETRRQNRREDASFTRRVNMIYVTTLDVFGLTADEYRKLLDKLKRQKRTEGSIYLHLTSEIPGGFRIVEIWDSPETFRDFLKKRFRPANKALKLNRKTSITVAPLHNFFGPRLVELRRAARTLPGSSHRQII